MRCVHIILDVQIQIYVGIFIELTCMSHTIGVQGYKSGCTGIIFGNKMNLPHGARLLIAQMAHLAWCRELKAYTIDLLIRQQTTSTWCLDYEKDYPHLWLAHVNVGFDGSES